MRSGIDLRFRSVPRLRLGQGSGIGCRSFRALLESPFTEVRLVRKAGIRGLKVLAEGLPNPSPLGSGHLRLLLLGLDVLGLGLRLRGLLFHLQPRSICTRACRSRVSVTACGLAWCRGKARKGGALEKGAISVDEDSAGKEK